jgi:ATP-dependent RNA helicase DDX35
MDSETTIAPLYVPPSLLPITQHKESILYTIETTHVTIIIGQTGSGKTTQIPQFLQKVGWCNGGKSIAITQPRRVAATSVAARVAEEMRVKVGDEVGYSIRFEDVTSSKTRIKFLTDGMLLREALVDPLLSRYSVIMVDEAHERSLSSDILLGLLKKIKKKRPELRIIVSSATLEAERVAEFFSLGESSSGNEASADGEGVKQCRILSIAGRAHPVDIMHLSQPAEDYLEKAVSVTIQIHKEEPAGDILVFLTGREEIENAVQQLSEYAADLPQSVDTIQPLPLYAGLPIDQQMYIFSPAAERTRKVVFSTNIAEASVTIPGIVYVIDSGFVKVRSYNSTTNISSLAVTPVSKASAVQRAGRAGRIQPGKCFRLYTQSAFNSLPETTIPEIQRTDLAQTVLQLKALGIDNIIKFPFLSPPPPRLLSRALELLYSLNAIDDYAKLTHPLGTRMAELALPPAMAAVLLNASTKDHNCLNEMLSIAAMSTLSAQGNIWFHHEGNQKAMDLSRRKFAAEEGDHITYLNVYAAFTSKARKGDAGKLCRDNHLNYKSMQKAISIRNQLRRYLERLGIRIPDDGQQDPQTRVGLSTRAEKASAETILKCLTTGYFANAAKMQPDGTFKSVSGGVTLHAHPTSLMFNRKAEYVIFGELLETGGSKGEGKIYIKDVSKIEKKWLVEYSRGYYNIKS